MGPFYYIECNSPLVGDRWLRMYSAGKWADDAKGLAAAVKKRTLLQKKSQVAKYRVVRVTENIMVMP